MGLALAVYLLVYALLLNNLESRAQSLRQFCDNIGTSASLQDITLQAEQQGMMVTVQALPTAGQTLFFIAQPTETDAVCRGLAAGDLIGEHQLVLKWF
jgi:glycerol dehydrogenase-like iron-containing ADH family enzyme